MRGYLRRKGQKQGFERLLSESFDGFLDQALQITEDWRQYQESLEKTDKAAGAPALFCHGDYQYHNILRCEGGWRIVNFEKCIRDSQIRDLYLLLRKLLEKSGWPVPLGRELLEAYQAIRPISAYDYIDLYYRLSYPEKFWKISNFYYNSGKAWIPERNREKLEKLLAQEKEKQSFLDAVFRNCR